MHQKGGPRKRGSEGRKTDLNCGVSVDLNWFLSELRTATCWEPSNASMLLGTPGEYVGSTPTGGATPGDFGIEYLFKQVMSKYDDQDKASDASKTLKALSKFREAEQLCTETNRRVDRYFYGFLPDNPDVKRALLLARQKIWNLLGRFSWDDVAAGMRLTSGASVKLPRARGFPAYKYSAKVESTSENLPAALALTKLIPSWDATSEGGSHIDICEGNRLSCVPKNYKTHRLIAMEPFSNMFLQKGFGAALRARLLAVGNDLRDQQPNQEWARMGSKTGLVATVDLSMASDTLSASLVEWMLPADWVEAMSYCRSRVGVLPSGDKVLYRKWSSMGNAYTFELETLIFWAIGQGVCAVTGNDSRFTRTYGDDIIVPSGASELLLETLREAGFVPNPEKSFWDGAFRESCGKHYFLGEDVTPFYIDAPVRRLAELFLLANNLERWRRRLEPNLTEGVNEALIGLVHKLRALAPTQWRRPRIPDGKGDGAFIGTFDQCLPSRPRGKFLWWEGWQVEVLARRYKTKRVAQPLGETEGMLSSSKDGITFLGWLESSLAILESRGHEASDEDRRFWDPVKEISSGTACPVDTKACLWVIQRLIVTQFS